MKEVLLEEVFRLLEEGTRLEKSGEHRIEAATKYYESCYLMRQIVAKTDEEPTEDNSEGKSTIGTSSRRLLENKIDHYTSKARKLYFDDGETSRNQQQQQPATSVMIGLLDDAISVLTESPSFPPPITVPVLGFSEKPNVPPPIPVPEVGCSTEPIAPPSFTDNQHQPTTRNKKTSLNRCTSNREMNQNQSSRWTRVPRCALAAIERRIQIRANIAHSTLSKAIDLDEMHTKGRKTRGKAIVAYMEASELYLNAIQLGEEQKGKLNGFAARRPKPSSSSSAALVQTMGDCLNRFNSKLKRIVKSTLDRIEDLKKEDKRHFQYQHPVMASASIASSIHATPIVSKVSESVHKPSLHDWFRGKENMSRSQKRKEETNRKASYSRGQSPTTVVWLTHSIQKTKTDR